MLDPEFARTGFTCMRPTATKITRFQVLGERSSGTNYVKRLLGRNTALTPTEALGWKHGFPHALAIPPDLAVIGVVRNAQDWARSMHAKPWHCSPALQSLELSDFLRAPWDTCVDRPRYFDGAKEAGTLGQPLMHDRHPLTGQQFDNLFELRKAKLDGLLSYANRACCFVLLRLEDVVAAPEHMLERVQTALDLPPRTQPFRPVFKRLGSKFKPSVQTRPDTPKQLTPSDLALLKTLIDPAQEQLLGYRYET